MKDAQRQQKHQLYVIVSYPTLKGWVPDKSGLSNLLPVPWDLLGFSALARDFTCPPPNGCSIRLGVFTTYR